MSVPQLYMLSRKHRLGRCMTPSLPRILSMKSRWPGSNSGSFERDHFWAAASAALFYSPLRVAFSKESKNECWSQVTRSVLILSMSIFTMFYVVSYDWRRGKCHLVVFVKKWSIKIIFQNRSNVLIRNFASETISFPNRKWKNCKSSHINTHTKHGIWPDVSRAICRN